MPESIIITPSIQSRADAFLTASSRMLGAKLIALLRSQPGHPVPLPELCRCIYLQDEVVEEHSPLQIAPIPLADKRAQAEYLQRAQVLRTRLASGATDPDLNWELEWLSAELRRITRPRGAIKYIHPEQSKAYHTFYTAIWKLLRKARKTDPDISRFLRSHLRTGKSFVWYED